MNMLVRFLPEFAEDVKAFSQHDRSVIKAAVENIIKYPYKDEKDGGSIPVPDYVDINVSDKVVKIIQSYVGVVNKMVWRKS